MTAYETFVHLFEVLDHIYDEEPNEKLGDYLSGLNPFMFEGEGSADPAEFDEFNLEYLKKFPLRCAQPECAYDFCKEYLNKFASSETVKAFDKISLEDWVRALEKE